MAVCICPWKDGIAQGAKDGGVHMSMNDGIAQGARGGGVHMSMNDGIAQGARGGGVHMPTDGRYDRCFLLPTAN